MPGVAMSVHGAAALYGLCQGAVDQDFLKNPTHRDAAIRAATRVMVCLEDLGIDMVRAERGPANQLIEDERQASFALPADEAETVLRLCIGALIVGDATDESIAAVVEGAWQLDRALFGSSGGGSA